MSSFFGSTMVLRQRGLHSSHAREEGRAHERARGNPTHPSVRPSVRPRARLSFLRREFSGVRLSGKFMARSQLGSPWTVLTLLYPGLLSSWTFWSPQVLRAYTWADAGVCVHARAEARAHFIPGEDVADPTILFSQGEFCVYRQKIIWP